VDIVIDSSVLVGLLVPNDVWHTRAVALWTAIEQAGHRGVFFDCVVAETVSAATRRLRERGRGSAVRSLLDRLSAEIPPNVLTWVLPEVPRLYTQVMELVGRTSGELNFHDGLIALACQERGIPAIASFDSDFDLLPWLNRMSAPSDVQPVG
jgi:predicted nucleic acid-binding protein